MYKKIHCMELQITISFSTMQFVNNLRKRLSVLMVLYLKLIVNFIIYIGNQKEYAVPGSRY